MRGTYTRWTRSTDSVLAADILGSDTAILANPNTGMITCVTPERTINPDEARMIGVRLIEAAALADGARAIRTAEGLTIEEHENARC